jgi:hypothetical protein
MEPILSIYRSQIQRIPLENTYTIKMMMSHMRALEINKN